jgi:serine protease Do
VSGDQEGVHPREGIHMVVSLVRLSVAIFVAFVTFGPDRIVHAQDAAACDTVGIVARALPATVNITVVKVLKEDDAKHAKSAPESIDVAAGSGVIIDPSGVIVTNKHVIQGGAHMWVTFSDRSQVDAQLLGAAGLIDVALLKVNVPRQLPVLKFANSDAARIGEPVIAIGNPLGIGTSISTGVVSGVNRDLMRSPLDDFIQTDASINPGNSGGALLNCAGDVIGINSALRSNNKHLGSIGLGFALPANDVAFVVPKLLDSQTASPTWVGVHMQDLTASLADTFGRPNRFGAIVTGIDADSPAARAGIAIGDVISAVDGREMSDARAVVRTIITKAQGQPISLTVCRGDDTRNVTLTGLAWPHMMELRSDVLASAESVARAQAQGIGLHVVPAGSAIRRLMGMADGVGATIDRITAGSQAETIGLKVGDTIEQVNDRPVKSPGDVPTAYGHNDPRTGKSVALLVRGPDKERMWVSLFVGRVDVAELLTQPPSVQVAQPPAVQVNSSAARDAAAGKR